ncbi:hypothetical protein HSISS3_575 [Streptococcus sp. HSISS3]|nr:hypothetical protein HSISS3_575 [Streptococcus sp. HSISS3]
MAFAVFFLDVRGENSNTFVGSAFNDREAYHNAYEEIKRIEKYGKNMLDELKKI